ncbi:MAG: rhomboid family intramembrane serine protease [Bdellovibrionaceae bacterium]|nr:rhomboid family intramembrane serine protease [Pseudobdellovibrionaceae bacterium]
MGGGQMQVNIPLTPMVKKLVFVNVAIWVVFVMILQKVFLSQPYVFDYFGLIPAKFFNDFLIWQPLSYMFLHSSNLFHILFNMLVLWMFGSELEARWGGRFFLIYYLVCGIGAAFIYIFCTFAYYFFTNDAAPLLAPVIGASGATFGLILAYGLVFSERMVLFMFIFPMKAKYFALLLGFIEFMTLLDSGFGSQVANLAHLGGVVSGFLFLIFYTRWKKKKGGKKSSSHGRRLKLVVDNENNNEKRGPRYWN